MKIDFSTWILAHPSFKISFLEQEDTHSTVVISIDDGECQFTDHHYYEDDEYTRYFLISKATPPNSWGINRVNVWIEVVDRKYKMMQSYDASLDPYIEMVKAYLTDVGEID